MSNAEKHTPDEAELTGCYAGAMEEQAGEDYDQAKADAERGIAKIRADALREAALMFSSRLGNSYSGVAVRGMLDDRADRIEEEA